MSVTFPNKLKGLYLAGVSGGPDSMAMLYVYKQHVQVVCHINYQKRISANRDQAIVEKFCKQHHFPCEVFVVDKKTYNKYLTRTNNFQTLARMIRYDFFKKIANKYKNQKILIAHNLDDFMESAIMQKSRGKRLFLGIQSESNIGNLHIYRPLINIRKQDLLQYCNQKHIPYGIDETNESNLYTRNVIRKEISKWSSSKFKDTYNKINKFNQTNKKKAQSINLSYLLWSKTNFDVKVFNKLPNNIKDYVLYQFLSDTNVSNISETKIKAIIQFISKSRNHKQYRLGNNQFIKIINSKLII